MPVMQGLGLSENLNSQLFKTASTIVFEKQNKTRINFGTETKDSVSLCTVFCKAFGILCTFMVCEKKTNVLSLCRLSMGTCFTPNTTDASEMSSFIKAPAFA